MNYYPHHLGDHMRDTAQLSILEDGVYRRLLDAYYVHERPLPAEQRECCKIARAVSKRERDAVAYVLKQFFQLRDDGYHQRRADVEIERFRQKSAKAKVSSILGVMARRCKTERSTERSCGRSTERVISPITNNQEPITKSQKAKNPTAHPKRMRPETSSEFLELKALYPKRAWDEGWHKALTAAHARIQEGHSWAEILEGARRYAAFIYATGKEGTQYIKQAATFLGPEKHFLESWALPATKAENQRDANIEASKAWLDASQ
jgi:uncharacterized protein YdaU (DUF1376 family)